MSAPAVVERAAAPLRVGGTAAMLRRWGRGLWRRILLMTPWQWVLAALLLAYTVVMSVRSIEAHHGLATSAYDLGIFEQGVWLLSRFETPFVTLRGLHLFGDHTSFILIPLLPLYWMFPTTGTLLTVQSAALAAGALPVFLYARHRLGSEAIAVLLGAVYLLHPHVSRTSMDHFHPDAFFGVFVGFAIYGALMSKWRLYAVFVVLTLLVKEDAALAIVPLAVWVFFRRDRLIGAFTALWAVAFTSFATVVVLQYFSGYATLYAGRIPFGGPVGFIRTALTQPGHVWEYLTSGNRPWYAWQLTAPFAWVFLRLPEVALMGSVAALGNIVSTHTYQHDIRFHYSMVVVAALAMGTVHALGALRRHRGVFVTALVAVTVASVWTAYLWGTFPQSRDPSPYRNPMDPVVVAAREVLPMIPGDAAISVDHRLSAHLSRRVEVYFFPNPFYTHYYGTPETPGGSRLLASDGIEWVVVRTEVTPPEHAAAWRREQHAFELVFGNDHYQVWRRAGE